MIAIIILATITLFVFVGGMLRSKIERYSWLYKIEKMARATSLVAPEKEKYDRMTDAMVMSYWEKIKPVIENALWRDDVLYYWEIIPTSYYFSVRLYIKTNSEESQPKDRSIIAFSDITSIAEFKKWCVAIETINNNKTKYFNFQ